MPNKFSAKIETFFKKQEFCYYLNEGENEDTFTIPINLDDFPSLIIKLYVEKEGRVNIITKICTVKNDEKRKEMIYALNKLNNKYSFVSFSISDEGNLLAICNFFVNMHCTGEMVMRYLTVFFSISDDVVKEVLPILWKKDKIEEMDADAIINDLLSICDNEDNEENNSNKEMMFELKEPKTKIKIATPPRRPVFPISTPNPKPLEPFSNDEESSTNDSSNNDSDESIEEALLSPVSGFLKMLEEKKRSQEEATGTDEVKELFGDTDGDAGESDDKN